MSNDPKETYTSSSSFNLSAGSLTWLIEAELTADEETDGTEVEVGVSADISSGPLDVLWESWQTISCFLILMKVHNSFKYAEYMNAWTKKLIWLKDNQTQNKV